MIDMKKTKLIFFFHKINKIFTLCSCHTVNWRMEKKKSLAVNRRVRHDVSFNGGCVVGVTGKFLDLFSEKIGTVDGFFEFFFSFI